MKDIERFIKGFRVFQENYFGRKKSPYTQLKNAQNPKTMIIGCSDSRVDPATLTNCLPGDIFVVRNVANLVPPFEDDLGRHGVSAALEFAVCNLKIGNIIIFGHSQCGGINALMNKSFSENKKSFIYNWMLIAKPAYEKALSNLAEKETRLQQRAVEQASILLSLDNLKTFPFIAERVNEAELCLYGWYFDLQTGELFEYHPDNRTFQRITS